MADLEQDSLLREIDEDLRHEHYAKLWRKYGTHVIGAALALVVAVAAYQGWRSYDLSRRMAVSERFVAAQALMHSNQARAAADAFAGITKDARGGYALLARFQQARSFAQSADRVRAAGAYRTIADDQDVDSLYRDLAQLLAALVEIDDADPQALGAQLAPLAKEDNPWRHSAREILALLAQRAGERDRAQQLFTALAQDASTPAGIRARANEMLAFLGG